MPKRRLPIFWYYSPTGIFSRRKRFLREALCVGQISGRTAIFLLVSAVISVGLLITLLGFRARSSLSPLDLAKDIRARRWTPPTLRQYRRNLSSNTFLPDPDFANIGKLENLQQQLYLEDADHGAITAIVPVTAASLGELHATVFSLLSVRLSNLKEIIIVCHPRIISRTEQEIKSVRAALHLSPVVTVLQSSPFDSQSLGILHVLPSVLTSRVLLLETTALRDVDDITKMILLDTAFSAIPVGPCGVIISPKNVSCVCSSEHAVPVAYLIPPFLAPTSLLILAENGMRSDVDTWAALGQRIVRMSGNGFGGVVVGTRSHSQRQCTDTSPSINNQSASTFQNTFYGLLEQDSVDEWFTPLRIDVLLPTRADLEAFGPTACEMAQHGSVLRVMLFSWSHSDLSTHFALDLGCHLHFETISRDSPTSVLINKLKSWVLVERGITVLMYASQILTHTLAIEASVEALQLAGVTIVRLPVEDLPFCEWMSVLSVSEWKNWQKPRIDLSVITHDRPRSLTRLLASLTTARYYGDSVHLKVNLEQTADAETRKIVSHFRWDKGPVHVQHRVIAAGLLPAVIEAWYPHDNHSYGVLLEDDIELSPLFYAWIKMTVLKYRYGPPHTRAPTLFGVSLYQPTNLELRVEGRVPFEPRIIFAEHGLVDSRTPYLSQVPCSWGAVYFPEHFVEFHDYLVLRLSEVSHSISAEIIPDIRSNHWTRSWKKYFNELVYLRGYVMLYPNYDLSLATNHVEVGTHVKSDANHIRASIKRQFEVALMPLPAISSGNTMASLLDLPAGSLPVWDKLPVLDLWGILTSHEEIASRGQIRHEFISGCPPLRDSAPLRHDATELLCARHIAR